MSALLPLLVGLPLAGAIACAALHARVLSRRRTDPEARPGEILVGAIATGAASAAFVLALALFVRLLGLPAADRRIGASLGTWIDAGTLRVPASLLLDPLSSILALVVTGVGALIHLYSIGYMRGDPGFARYFACLNLFLASMLLLVLGANLPLTFVGWEGVGLCSYLLIGFWYGKGWPADAGLKAFVVNRVGDAGFLLGIFLLQKELGALDYASIGAAASTGKIPSATWAAALLFCGAVGKSAQIPLQVWLPDAMAGPTPVSALIHAATMVTAGVYLLARLSALFLAAPGVLLVVGIVGGATAVLAGLGALASRDLKRALACSTVSQLGLMFLGEGAGAFDAGIAHLTTHAFFKALLFLAAGSVIHALGGEQDLAKMGGLRARIPATFLCFCAGAWALSGLPPLAGFFSKDEILGGALHGGHAAILASLGFAASFLTALYSFRLVYLVFSGRENFAGSPHESPGVMLAPMRVLAALSLLGGALAWIPIADARPIAAFLAPVLGGEAAPGGGAEHVLVAALSFAVASVGFLLARRLWRDRGLAGDEGLARTALWRLAAAGGVLDAFYRGAVARGARLLAIACGVFDLFVIDGAVNGVGRAASAAGASLRALQNGKIQSYGIGIAAAAGALLLAGLLLGRG
ncbi:MAG: NADH-quinone oxidoreductase subunit L [Planctomycetes bacterium]|nr:NADH-quinone oxidoreductase subunit L [Planctomycetota bacterium]